MFSQACVKNSVHRGCPGPGLGGSAQGGVQAQAKGMCIPACTEADPPPQQTATAADGMHPSGMHSCLLMSFLSNMIISILSIQSNPGAHEKLNSTITLSSAEIVQSTLCNYFIIGEQHVVNILLNCLLLGKV